MKETTTKTAAKKTTTATTKKTATKTATTTKTATKKTTTKDTTEEKKTRAKKTKDVIEMPEFKTIKEELAWLKAKKNRTDFEQMRLEYLDSPVKVICDKQSLREAEKERKKKATKKKKVKPAVLLENGEYVPTPKTFTQLKSYINTYCRAMGWKDKKFKFDWCKPLGFKDFKVTGDKEKQEVYITGSLVFQTPKQMFTKGFSKTFTLENHKQIRELIRNTYRAVLRNWKDKTHVDGDELMRKGWSCVYDE